MATATKEKTKVGKISQVVGVVVDVEFSEGHLPAIYNALTVDHNGKELVLEVAQHLSESSVRAVSLGGIRNPVWPSFRISMTPLTAYATAGSFAANASTSARGRPSQREVSRKALDRSRISRMSSRRRQPRNFTRAAMA